MTGHHDTTGLPDPACELGYPADQLDAILGADLLAFDDWFGVRTLSMCDGRRYDYRRHEYLPTGCGPHGAVVSAADVAKFRTWHARKRRLEQRRDDA